MTPERIFCGWDQPALTKIIDFLSAKYCETPIFDLSNCLLVFSGARAGRRLLERLALFAKERALILTPPKIVTTGSFPELLYVPELPIANQFEATLAWAKVLSRGDPARIKLISGVFHDTEDIISWFPVAKSVSQLYSELSGNLLSFSEAGKKISTLPYAPEDPRWDILASVYDEYLSELAVVGLCDREAARLCALSDKRYTYEGTVLLCAVRDLNRIQRGILDALDCPIVSLVHAPQTESQSFDQYGCIDPEVWSQKEIPINYAKCIVAIDPSDQALVALKKLADLKGRYHQSEVVIGHTDSTLLPFIESIFQEANLKLHDPEGISLSSTRPALLLSSLANYLSSKRMQDFSSLLRFPEVEARIRAHLATHDFPAVESLIGIADMFQMTHLQAFSNIPLKAEGIEIRIIQEATRALDVLLLPFHNQKRTFVTWLPEIISILTTLYPDQLSMQSEFESITIAANLIIESTAPLLPIISGSQALKLFIDVCNDIRVPREQSSEDIETLGWLELQLDDAPAVVVCGMNEGCVPESVNADSFLPNRVRTHLGLLDNERRYARDAFVLSALVHSVTDLTLVYGRLDPEGSPLLPSRLLVQGNDESIVSTVKRLYLKSPQQRVLQKSNSEGTKPPHWELPPKPRRLTTHIDSMSVTAFKLYLYCPYRFYLAHVLALEAVDDSLPEMDAMHFGVLGHSVLAAFAKTNASLGTSATDNQAILSELLDQSFEQHYGTNPLPATLLQREQLRSRLSIFATWNANWRKQGWETKHIEYKPSTKALTCIVDGEPFRIEGRIDRIDYHPQHKSWAVFDYKFSDKALDPIRMHKKGDEWIDLQLPLYHLLLSQEGYTGTINVGYIRLSPHLSFDDLALFTNWSEPDYQAAYSCAYDIIRKVRAQEFWPPRDEIRPFDPFASILGYAQFFQEAQDETADS